MFQRMRYSKRALLVFGAGLVLGLVVVAAELPGLRRAASLAMALGIVLLPVAIYADWRRILVGIGRGRVGATKAKAKAKPKAKAKAKRRPPAPRRRSGPRPRR